MNTEGKCILVVDDELDVRNYLRAALEDAGVTILPSNAQAARYAGLIIK